MKMSIDTARKIAYEHYGIQGDLEKLAGEEDLNYFLKSTNQEEYLLKIGRPKGNQNLIELQISLVDHLLATQFPLDLPQVIPSKSGTSFVTEGDKRIIRLQKWVPGRTMKNVNPRSPSLLVDWGKTCGRLSLHLKEFDHPAAHRFYKWDPPQTLYSKKYAPYFTSEEKRDIGDYFWNLFDDLAKPHLNQLRHSINHNDVHEQNLLLDFDLSNPSITGLIDFGDTIYTATINELAVACAYGCMELPDPIEAATNLVRGYHSIFPIEELELSVLFPLICARLMITVSNAAWNRSQHPDNDYLWNSEKAAWSLLYKFHEVSPDFAHYRFRDSCGLEPCPKNITFQSWINSTASEATSLVDMKGKNFGPVDLSVSSLELGNNTNYATIHQFQNTINRILTEHNAEMGYGGYGEVRSVYTTDHYQTEGNSGVQWRTTHLGLDLWMEAGTPIFSPFKGVVYALQDNYGERNYGPTLIIKHEVNRDLTFYCLYGHLDLKSIENLQVGMNVSKSEQIATIGYPPENGNWPPHLHFQIILDLLGNEGDFPGVAYPHEAKTWLSISPDPGLIYPYFKVSQNGIQLDQILGLRKKNLGDNLSISYDQPLHIVRAFKQHLYDHLGRRYLDTVNNVPHVGHQHPRVVRAACRQMAILNTNTRYLHNNIVHYAQELLATFPPQLSVIYFVNSGSEANELALRMVKTYTGQKDIVAVEVGYHGNTGGCISVSSYKFDGKGGHGAPKDTHVVPIPDTYRGLYSNTEGAGAKYARHVKDVISAIQSEGRNIGGFICESILSCGGQIPLPEGYLEAVYQYVHDAGGLCIADEVQVGFGRVGHHFWAFELQKVIPDIVTMGKPMGNGHPLAAVATTREIADHFANGMEYFNTFGGNPVSCAIGREVLHIIQEENLQNNALDQGNYLKERLKLLQSKYDLIGDIRGFGLFLGIELVKNRTSLVPATFEAKYLVNRMRERGILMSTDGPYNNVIKIKPPLCFTGKDADFLTNNLDLVFNEDLLRNQIRE